MTSPCMILLWLWALKIDPEAKLPSWILAFAVAVFMAVVYFADEINGVVVNVQEALPVQFDLTNVGMPVLHSGAASQVVVYSGHTLSYNSTTRLPNWVAYELTSDEVKGKEKRTDKFVPDPMVNGTQASNADYRRSGWDKGHLAPAADMKWSRQAVEESFYMSNISPQDKKLNRGVWKSIETLTRDNAMRYGKVLVVTGPVFNAEKERRTIGKNEVVIPDAFYKVLLVEDKGLRGVGFYCENVEGNVNQVGLYARSIDEIEGITGIDFFYTLPDDIEEKVESSFDWKYWNTGGKK